VVQEKLLGGKPTPLEISRGLPGSRWSGKSGDQPLELDTSRGRAVWKPESIPPGARKFHLSLRVENLSQWVRVHLELGPGGQDILFWHPRPVARKVSHEFTGWLTVSLPLSLAPAPGSELSLELERLFPSSPVSGKLLELRVAFPSGS
jgi:hypothetical protein